MTVASQAHKITLFSLAHRKFQC